MSNELTAKKILLLLLANAYSFFTVATLLFISFLDLPLSSKTLLSLFIVYIVPPILTRMVLFFSPLNGTEFKIGSKEYMTWWFTSSFQTLFLRFPFLEELLRVFPGVYSMWLRVWGAKIGKRTYWSPGTKILDRSFIVVGDEVIFGFASTLCPHIIKENAQKERSIVIAPVIIGHQVIVGSGSVLGPGTVIASKEVSRALLYSPPFSHWENGQRMKKAGE